MLKRIRNLAAKHRLLTLVGTVGLLLVAGYFAHGLWRLYLVEGELKQLRSQGIPTSAEELNAFVTIPPDEPNATAAWMKPINGWRAAIGTHPWGFRLLDSTGEFPPAPGEEWCDCERAEQYIAKHAAYFQLIDAAVATEGRCCFVADYAPDNVSLPHVDALRLIVKHLALRAFVRAHNGDRGGALRDLQAMIFAAESLRHEPIMISQLVRGSLLEYSSLTLERLLMASAYEDKMLRELQKSLEQLDVLQGLQRAVIGQRVMGLEYLSESRVAIARRTFLGDHPLEFLRLMHRIEGDVQDDWATALRLSGEFVPRDWGSTRKQLPWGGTMHAGPSAFVSVFATKIPIWAVKAARLRCASATVATVRFHALEERWPESLEELVPDYLTQVPVDPFTGAPIFFVRDEAAIRVYSVGPNRLDDGGSETPETDDDGNQDFNGAPDVVFRVRLR